MRKKLTLSLIGVALFAAVFVGLVVPGPALAGWHVAPTPTPTPLPLLPAKIGSNAHLAIGAVVLVLIIFLGVAINIRRKK